MVFKKLLKKISELGGNTLYYPGCLTKFAAPELADNYRKILNQIGIDFIEIPEFKCCGGPVFNAGYTKDFYTHVEAHLEVLKKYGVTKIITNCPSCALVFKKHYKLNAKHMTEVLVDHLKHFESPETTEPACYHDPCHLGRKGGIYEQPRQILAHLGYEVVEMSNTKRTSLCCGGGGGLRTNNNDMSNKVAKIRLQQCKTNKLITPCPLCYKHLKENAPKDIKVLELSEVLLK